MSRRELSFEILGCQILDGGGTSFLAGPSGGALFATVDMSARSEYDALSSVAPQPCRVRVTVILEEKEEEGVPIRIETEKESTPERLELSMRIAGAVDDELRQLVAASSRVSRMIRELDK